MADEAAIEELIDDLQGVERNSGPCKLPNDGCGVLGNVKFYFANDLCCSRHPGRKEYLNGKVMAVSSAAQDDGDYCRRMTQPHRMAWIGNMKQSPAEKNTTDMWNCAER